MRGESQEPAHGATPRQRHAGAGWAPYVIPMAAFAVMSWLEGAKPELYPWLYGAKAVVVTAALVICRSTWRDARPDWRVAPIAAVVGLLVLAEWLLIPQWFAYPRLSERPAFDPGVIADPIGRAAFLAVRLYGLVLMVPLMEELFWRSFLLRALSERDWEGLPMGTFTWSAFAFAGAAFAVAHPEWLEAAICAAAYMLLLRHTKSLFACVVAHAVTNLGLGIYVLASGNWHLW